MRDDPILTDPDLVVTDDVRDEEARTDDPRARHEPLSAEEAAMRARREEEEGLGLNDDPDPGYLEG